MTDKEKIRAEIERRLKRENEILWNAKLRGTYASPSCEYNLLTLTSIRDFINSLPEESVDVDSAMKELDEKIELTKEHGSWKGVDVDEFMREMRTGEDDDLGEAPRAYRKYVEECGVKDPITLNEAEEAFDRGMEVQKKMMMREAVEGEVVKDISNKLAVTAKINLDGFKFGEKVKILILKNE